MRTRADQLAKGLLAGLLGRLGTAQRQFEIPGEVQAADLYFVPAPGLAHGQAAERARLGLVGRLAETPCLIESFHAAPRIDEVLDCLSKQLTLRRALVREAARQKQPQPAVPRLWILSAGRPEQLMQGLGLVPMQGWPVGFWAAPTLLRMSLVVLRDLPETRETLLLRLLGAGVTFRRAMQELHGLPPEAWEVALAMPLLLAFRVEVFQAFEDDEVSHMDEFQAIYEDWERRVLHKARDEGRAEGWQAGREEGRLQTLREGLARVYEARFGALPPELGVIIAAKDEETLRQWLAPFATRSADEIAAVVVARDAAS